MEKEGIQGQLIPPTRKVGGTNTRDTIIRAIPKALAKRIAEAPAFIVEVS
jgi:hypothetical protein